jgi:hypothetical protein
MENIITVIPTDVSHTASAACRDAEKRRSILIMGNAITVIPLAVRHTASVQC